MANSRNFLSMTRLFDIYKTKENKFKGMIKNDKKFRINLFIQKFFLLTY